MLIDNKNHYQYRSYIVFWKINMQTIHKLSKKWTRSLFKGLTHYTFSPSWRTFWEKFTEIKKTNLSCEEKDFSLGFLTLKRGLCKICFKWPTLVITHIPHTRSDPVCSIPATAFSEEQRKQVFLLLDYIIYKYLQVEFNPISIKNDILTWHHNGVCLASVSSVYKTK